LGENNIKSKRSDKPTRSKKYINKEKILTPKAPKEDNLKYIHLFKNFVIRHRVFFQGIAALATLITIIFSFIIPVCV
jgi:hypothetical protein